MEISVPADSGGPLGGVYPRGVSPLDRRGFLVRTGLGLAAAALAAGDLEPAASAQPQSLSDWTDVRALFNVDPNYLHFGGLLLASHPSPVREAIDAHRRGLDDNPVDYLHQNEARFEASVLRSASAYFGRVRPTDIALTDSTTMGLGLLYNGLDVRADHELLTTTHDFYATHESLRYKAERSGAALRFAQLYADSANATQDEIVGSLAAAITPRTRVVAVTWVHSSTGVKLPIRALADVVGNANASRDPSDRALLCVDGVHGLGVEDVDLADLGCDFFVAGCHKWLFGPRGTGIVWGDPRAWPAAAPTIPTFSDGSVPGGAMTPGGFHSFEHRWALAQAFDLHRQIGKSQIAARVHALNRQLKEGLAAMGHVRLRTPLDENVSAGLVCFEVAGLSPQGVVDRLHAAGVIATVTPYAMAYARLAAGLLNSPEEVDAVLGAVRGLA
jgi:selenocysteine lyase/cysteine desulfurase